ncbi:MAG: transglutaminase-like domain-containing protein [Candidatus Woesearchaeota archaeon]
MYSNRSNIANHKIKLVYLIIFIILFSITMPFISASKTKYDKWNIVSDSLLIDFNISTNIYVKQKSEKSVLKNINLSLGFFPKNDYRQNNVMFDVAPKDYKIDKELLFNFENPTEKSYEVKIDSNLKTTNMPVKISEKIPFPIFNIPEEYILYMEITELIDYKNKAIVELASKIAEGKDDLYEIIFDMAVWTHLNINYSLDTVTAEASLPASWVLKNRRGVCDELTNLFISMVRSIGVPAKFVAGISYTESELFDENWGTHGWAEVYIPKYGWVPFDVTYGQFGIIDPTHIKLKESFDSDKTSTSFEWLGYDVDIVSSGIKMNTEVIDYGTAITERVEIINSLAKDIVGFGSYDLVKSNVKNKNNFYLPLRLSISKVDGTEGIESLEIIDPLTKYILLKPNEERNIFWRIKVSDKLSKSSIYTFPIHTYTSFDEKATIELRSKQGEVMLSHKDVQLLMESSAPIQEKTYSRNIEMLCTPKQAAFYVEEDVIINCRLKNKGNININDLTICTNGDCKKIELKISQERDISFLKENLGIGKHELIISAKNNKISEQAKASFVIEEIPKLDIIDEKFPEIVKFSDVVNIGFTLTKETISNPKSITVKLISDFMYESWEISQLSEDREFVLALQPNSLTSKTNNFKVLVEYHDRNSKKYELSKDFRIDVEKLTLKDRAVLYMNKLNSDPKLAVGIGLGITALIIIIWFVKLHRKK